jgi:hypothetical protein
MNTNLQMHLVFKSRLTLQPFLNDVITLSNNSMNLYTVRSTGNLFHQLNIQLKGQPHENVDEIRPWDVGLGPNQESTCWFLNYS